MNNEEQTTQNLLDRIVALQQRVRELEEREAQCREQTQALRQQLAQEQATRQNLETTLHQTEAALRQSEEHRRLASERFQLAATAVSALIYDWDIESDTVERTDGLTRILGYTLTDAEPTGQWWRDRVHPEDLQRVYDEAAIALAKGDFYTGEYRILHKNNHYIHVLDQGLVVARDAQGNPVRVIGSTTDISARKLVQEALQEREQRFSTLFNGMKDWVLVYHLTPDHQPGQFIEVNEQACKRLGYTRQELLTMSVADLVGSPWVNPKANVKKLLIDKFVVVESVHRTKDGQLLPVEVSATLFTLNGLPTVQAICRDITERKLAEEALRKSERLYRAIGETIDYGIWVCEPDGRNIYASESFLQLVGLTQEQCSDFGWGTVLYPDDADRTIAAWQECARSGDFWDIEHRFRGVDGNWHPILARGVPVRDENGEIICWAGINLDISRLKQTEEALRHSEQRLRLALEAARMVAWEWNLVDDTLVYSATAVEIFGLRPGTKLESSEQAIALIHPDDSSYHRQIVNSAIASSGSYVAQFRLIRPIDGTVVWLEERGSVICDRTDKAVKLTGVLMDITELKQAEAALRDSEALATSRAKELEVFMEAVPAGVWIARDPQCHHVTANRTAYELVQLPSGSVATATPADGMYPFAFQIQRDGQDIPLHELPMQQAGRTGQDVEAEFDFVFETGEVRSIYGRAVPLRDNVGEVRGVIGAFLDVSERKRAEAALRESVERLNLALAASYMGDWSWDAATDVVTFSERAAEIFGIPSGPYMTWTQMRELLHEDDRDRARLMVEQAIRERSDYNIEYRVIRPDGIQCWVCAKGRAQYDVSDRVLGMFGVVQDITERKHAEHLLQESEAIARARADELEALMQITPVALWIAHDPNCHYMSANQTAYDLMRAAPGSVTTATPADGSYPLPFKQRRNGEEVVPQDLPMQRAARTGKEVKDEMEFVFEDGTVRFIYGKAVPLRNESGDVRGVIGAFVDITERKQAEREREQLLARERAAREEAQAANRIKDEFLAVLSHELRSPLNPILGWAKLLQTRKFDEQATQRALSTIERNAKLQTQLIEDLLDVSRILRGKMDLKVYPVNLVAVIDAALETVRLAAEAKGIEIQTRLAPDVGQVSGDAGRLQQVVLNLVSNAVKFTPSGGRVEIRLERVGRDAQIQVTDTGKGIKPEFLPHVFDYFRQEDGKTTRNFGGLGLGLAIVRHLVELHGGTVQAESPGEGQGATFTVRLPLIAIANEIAQDDTPSIATSPLNRLHILAVDDIADMRELLATILEQYGAIVRVAASAGEALIAIEQFKPDLLISDIGMSGIDGYMLLQQVRQLPPERGGLIPAIALTAYASEFDHQQALTAGFQKHIPKPVEPEELVKAITALLVEMISPGKL